MAFVDVTLIVPYRSPLLYEAGHVTPKYMMLRKVILKCAPSGSVPPVPANPLVMAVPGFTLNQSIAVTSAMPNPIDSKQPLSFEDMNQAYGYYGGGIRDNRQGIIGAVHLGDVILTGWQNYSLPMTDPSSLKFTSPTSAVMRCDRP